MYVNQLHDSVENPPAFAVKHRSQNHAAGPQNLLSGSLPSASRASAPGSPANPTRARHQKDARWYWRFSSRKRAARPLGVMSSVSHASASSRKRVSSAVRNAFPSSKDIFRRKRGKPRSMKKTQSGLPGGPQIKQRTQPKTRQDSTRILSARSITASIPGTSTSAHRLRRRSAHRACREREFECRGREKPLLVPLPIPRPKFVQKAHC